MSWADEVERVAKQYRFSPPPSADPISFHGPASLGSEPAPAPIHVSRRTRLRWAFLEVGRRCHDAARVLILGAELRDEGWGSYED